MKKGMFFLLVLSMLILSVFTVSATHDAIIAISPNIANCEELGNTFIVNIHIFLH